MMSYTHLILSARRMAENYDGDFSSSKKSNSGKGFFATLRKNFFPTEKEKQEEENRRRIAETKYNNIQNMKD